MKYLSMFSGIGTAEKGIEQAYDALRQIQQINGNNGFQRPAESHRNRSKPIAIGFAEIDKYASAIYRYHWPEVRNYGDATAIVCDELDDFEFLVAGFPCQSFSIAGKRQGFNEARGTLFFEIARILSHKRPRHFLLENVKGLLSSDDGKVYTTILRILADLDYRVETVVLNSKYYGVPQNRERVFFIGHLRDECCGEILSFGDGDGVNEQQLEPRFDGCTNSLTSVEKDNLVMMKTANCLTPDAYLTRGEHNRDENGKAVLTSMADRRIRRLTKIECERLQGLPDDFTKYGIIDSKMVEISSTQRYKTLGNAMTVNVIEVIVTRMLDKGCLE